MTKQEQYDAMKVTPEYEVYQKAKRLADTARDTWYQLDGERMTAWNKVARTLEYEAWVEGQNG